MKKIMLISIFIFSGTIADAWNEKDHQKMTELALSDVAQEWNLQTPCEVRPLQNLITHLSPNFPGLGDLWHFSDFLQINPSIDLSHENPNVSGKKTLTPLEILSTYAIDPDDGRDQNLFKRNEDGNPEYLFKDQSWFGSMSGGNSQAFRHMEKPPFRVKSPINTFGLPRRSVGEATKRAEIYFQLSQVAFHYEENYWGWRFLAGALHYIEDLHQPYHSAQITPHMSGQGTKEYFSWGRKKLGFIPTMAHIVSNSHRFYETYVSMHREVDHDLKQKAFDALKGFSMENTDLSAEELGIISRDTSNQYFADITEAVLSVTDPKIASEADFSPDAPEFDKPVDWLKSDQSSEEFKKANEKIFEVAQNRFESAGKIIRTFVWKARHENERLSPSERVEKIQSLLSIPLD